ncbi:MAG: GTPase ObgE [Bacteroidota bacterium]|nr:GTPase ObgE [Bacteroidota bacterium]MDP4233417.1 GTPase ObgE [Bacteroidota bacterium]MDP4242283.1 GTPase ObgE [Bacteroidota bacterium]MDP4287039.1 GTPase ObgE [Bacteroidota bacterium]
MQFIDEAKIRIGAGKGGDGVISWRREKYVPKGGPDGGNGGKGGDVYFEADPQFSTLLDFRYKREHEAEDGAKGGGSNCTGRNGEDLVLRMPVGTIAREAGTDRVLADLTESHQRILVAKGGKGGMGNWAFKSPTNQAPRKQTNGKPGEALEVELELKLLADVALVGFPNAGKSTLISRISAARPKIADYPFTTLVPNLGIVRAPEEHKSFVMADIPGLIEGASEGKGLGMQFLRHIERSRVLLFLLDGMSSEHDPKTAYKILRNELKRYDPLLLKRPSIIAITKGDAIGEDEHETLARAPIDKRKPLVISAVTGFNIDVLIRKLWNLLQQES